MQRSVDEVFKTFFEAFLIVIFVIFFFLRDWRAVVIPITAIPISIIGTFAVINALGFSINILTLLALVLAIGLVVDDAIVMLENIYRRIEEGETKIQAAVLGARQVAFAIIATTFTLAAVFLPVAFQSGTTGRLFYEFGVSLAVSVLVSLTVSLTVTPMLSSLLLKGTDPKTGHPPHGWFYRVTEPGFVFVNRIFGKLLRVSLKAWPRRAAALRRLPRAGTIRLQETEEGTHAGRGPRQLHLDLQRSARLASGLYASTT